MTAGPPAATVVGVLGEPRAGEVDAVGSLVLGDGPGAATLEWWVGAEDRWHRPTAEVAVRHRVLDGAPVSETVARIPGGDARWRVYGAATAWGPAIVVEASNLSPAPFALALALRFGAASAVRLSGTAIEVDGRAVLVAARPPGRVSAGAGDRFADVAAGDAVEVPATAAPDVDLGAAVTDVAALWPVPHGATLAFVLPMAASTAAASTTGVPGGGLAPAFASLPSAEAVARGWARQLDAVSGFDVGDPATEAAVRAELAARLLRAPTGGTVADAVVLDGWGHHDEAAAILRRAAEALTALPSTAPSSTEPPAAWLRAAAAHWRLTGDHAFAGAAADAVLAALRRAGRDIDDTARRAAVELLNAGGQAPAARHLAKRRRRAGLRRVGRGEADVEDRRAGLDTSTSSSALARAGLVGETDDGGLAVWPGWDAAGAGRAADVRRLPTAWGRLSFAVRWHGPRPALLWEVEPRPDRADGPAPTITAPTFDPPWQGHGWRGEALLAEPLVIGSLVTGPRGPSPSGPGSGAEPDGVSFR